MSIRQLRGQRLPPTHCLDALMHLLATGRLLTTLGSMVLRCSSERSGRLGACRPICSFMLEQAAADSAELLALSGLRNRRLAGFPASTGRSNDVGQ